MTETPSAATPQTADEIREEIEHTRAELGDTVDALTNKLDVKAQAHDRIDAAKASVSAKASQAKASAPAPVQNALNQAGTAAAPLVDKARPYRKQIAAGVGALLALVFLARRRSK